MSRARLTLIAPFDVVLSGLLVAIVAWALLAAAVMTSLAPLSRVVRPPPVAAKVAPCPADVATPELACLAVPGGTHR